MEWQIRERGTDKVLKEFEAVFAYINGSGAFCVVQENGAKEPNIEGFKFNLLLHYICRKGEILVNESEYDALKAELAELKAQARVSTTGSIDQVCGAVEAETPGEPEKEVTRYNVEEVFAEIIQASQYSSTIAQAWQTVLEHELEMQRIEASRINQGV